MAYLEIHEHELFLARMRPTSPLVQAQCRCGFVSSIYDNELDARRAYATHKAGLTMPGPNGDAAA
jgi:hypothetical protein